MDDETTKRLCIAISKMLRENPSCYTVINWRELSSRQLPFDFIKEFSPYLLWDVLCKHYPFTLKMFTMYRDRMNIFNLQSNPNIDNEILKIAECEMDRDIIQCKQKLGPDLLNKFYDWLDDILIFKYQDLTEDFILRRLTPMIKDSQWNTIRELLNIVFEHQSGLSIDFVHHFLLMEHGNIHLIDHTILTQFQALPEDFMEEQYFGSNSVITNLELLRRVRINISRCQQLTNHFISAHVDELNALGVLKNQQLNLEVLQIYYEKYVINGLDNADRAGENIRLQCAGAILGHQKFDVKFFNDLLMAIKTGCTNINISQWIDNVYSAIFLRSFIPVGERGHLGFSQGSVKEYIIPNINWTRLSVSKLNHDEINYIIDNIPEKISWYLLMKYNTLTEYQIEKLDENGYLSGLCWWIAITWPRSDGSKLSKDFLLNHKIKANWFHNVQDPEDFKKSAINAIQNKNPDDVLWVFLNDYVSHTDWGRFFREVKIKPWFMHIFAHFAQKIDQFFWKLCYYQNIDDHFARKYLKFLDFPVLIKYGYHNLSYEFIDEIFPFLDEASRKIIRLRSNLPGWFRIKHNM